jgi:hypothetical protein
MRQAVLSVLEKSDSYTYLVRCLAACPTYTDAAMTVTFFRLCRELQECIELYVDLLFRLCPKLFAPTIAAVVSA